MVKSKYIIIAALALTSCVINEVPIKSGDVPALSEYGEESGSTPIDKPSVTEGTQAVQEPQSLVSSGEELNEVDMTCNNGVYKLGTPYQVDGVEYTPFEDYAYEETGKASWYGHGDGFNAQSTANGEVYSKDEMTAAHRTLPLPSVVKVTNLENDKSVLVRVNDRGPFARDRIIDLSQAAAKKLGYETKGEAKVKVEIDAEKSSALKEIMQKCKASTAPEKVIEYVKDGSYYVQLAAFLDKARADKYMEATQKLGQVVMNEGDVKGAHYYRVQVGPFDKLEDAKLKLTELRAKSPTGAGLVKDKKWVPNI
jgi:rare lipoprotein A